MGTEQERLAAAAEKAANVKAEAAKAKAAGGPAHPAEVWEVRGPEGGRRRAGLRFTPVPMRVDTRDLTPKEVAAIAGDPALSVRVLAAAPAADGDPPKA